ncbi:hypothetical protein Tco_0204499 [Tanacetum coccineum]
MYHDLYLGGKALVEKENLGFNLTKSDLCPSFGEDLPAKSVGHRMADSHAGVQAASNIDDILIYSSLRMIMRHIVNSNGIHVDPSKIEAMKNGKVPKTSSKIQLFLGLAIYYRHFIVNFSRIAKPLTSMIQQNLNEEFMRRKNYTTHDIRGAAEVLLLRTWRHKDICTGRKSVTAMRFIRVLHHIFDQKELMLCAKESGLELVRWDYDYDGVVYNLRERQM